jgi:hypothetical protein
MRRRATAASRAGRVPQVSTWARATAVQISSRVVTPIPGTPYGFTLAGAVEARRARPQPSIEGSRHGGADTPGTHGTPTARVAMERPGVGLRDGRGKEFPPGPTRAGHDTTAPGRSQGRA